MKKYIIGTEEKKYIKDFLEYETRFNLNFLLANIEDNLIVGSEDKTYSNIYRDVQYYAKLAISLYTSIYKQSLNEKLNIDKMYIPLSLEEYNILKSNDKNSGFLLGTVQKFVAEAKPYPEIDDLVILEASLKNVSLFKLDETFEDSSLVIVGPSFKIEELDEEYEVDSDFFKRNNIQERKFKKVVVEFVPNKNEDVKQEDLTSLFEQGGDLAIDLENYWEILGWTNKLEEALEKKDGSALLKLGISDRKENEEEVTNEEIESEKDSEKEKDKIIEEKKENKKEKNIESEIEAQEESKDDEDENKENRENEDIENIKDPTDKVEAELEKIKREIEEKAEDVKKRLNILIDKTNYTAEGKPGEKILKIKEELKEEEEEKEKLNGDLEQAEVNAQKQIDLNYLEIHDIVKDIKEWKEKIVRGLNFEYLKKMTKIESEKNEYMKNANFTKEEKTLYKDIFDSMKYNIEKVEALLENTEDLIKAQQKFALIAAETGAKYSSVIDGFGIRNEAFKLKEILKKDLTSFEEKYYYRVTQNTKDKNKEKEKVEKVKDEKKNKKINKDKSIKEKSEKEEKNVDPKIMRISTKELTNILDTSNQISIFLNMLFNPKMAKPNTKINRFEELILLEENELKRKIFTYAKYLISEGNLDILEDEIDIIESRSSIKKLLDFISGKNKIESYYISRLEDTIDKIIELSYKDLKTDKNYRIHDIIAEIMMFKSENNDDEILEDIIKKLSKLELSIAKNFEINESKVLEVISDKKNISYPVAGKITKKDEIDIEIESLIRKYEYDDNIFVDEAKYEDTTKNEIQKIVDYAKISE